MGRITQFSPKQVTFAATTTSTSQWGSGDIDAAGIINFTVITASAGSTAAGNAEITGVRVKANGTTVIDLKTAELLAYQKYFSPSHSSDASTSGATNNGLGKTLNIPLNMLDAANDNAADACQFMPGATATVEVDYTTGANQSGAHILQWQKTTVDPEFYVTLIGAPTNVAASQTSAPVPIGAPGMVQAFGIDSRAMAQVKAIYSGLEAYNGPGLVFAGGAATGDGVVGGQNLTANTAAAQPTFQWVKTALGLGANPANSRLELTTGAGAATTNRMAIMSLVELNPQDEG